MILGKPEHGWCQFTLGEFNGECSYTTNVPDNVLSVVEKYYYYHRLGVIWFDEEGNDFTFVITPYNIYIISSREDYKLYVINDPVNDIFKQFVNDIETNLSQWAMWGIDFNNNNCAEGRYNDFKNRINKLKDYFKEHNI